MLSIVLVLLVSADAIEGRSERADAAEGRSRSADAIEGRSKRADAAEGRSRSAEATADLGWVAGVGRPSALPSAALLPMSLPGAAPLGGASLGAPAPEPKGEMARLAIVPMAIGGGRVRPLFVEARALAEAHVGIELARYDAIFTDGFPPLGDRVAACGSDLACAARHLRIEGYDVALLLTENEGVLPPLLTVEVLDAQDAHVRARWVGSSDPRALTEAIHATLERAGFPLGGWLELVVFPESLEVTPPLGEGGTRRRLVAPGRHVLHFAAPGFRPAERTLVVPRGGTLRELIELEREAEDPGLLASPLWWTAVGVALVGGTLAVLAATGAFDGDDPRCFCVTTPGAPPCPPCP